MIRDFITYRSFLITKDMLNRRIDSILVDISDISRNQIQRMIKNSFVFIQGAELASSSVIIKKISVVTIVLLPPEDTDIKPNAAINLDIIYEDEFLMVINKQSGLVVHPGIGHYNDTLINGLLYYKKEELSGIGGEVRPGIVHRLDKDTSGLLLIAKNDFSHQHLSSQIATKECRRIYKALVWGRVLDSGKIDTLMSKSRIDHFKMSIVRNGGKRAITHYKSLEVLNNNKLSLVQCELETGRTHQIRLHMSYIGHSIFGDQTYGNNKRKILNNFARLDTQEKLLGFKRQWLHACYISFRHPISNQLMEFNSAVSEELSEILSYIKGF